IGRPLAYAEKVIFAYADNVGDERLERVQAQVAAGRMARCHSLNGHHPVNVCRARGHSGAHNGALRLSNRGQNGPGRRLFASSKHAKYVYNFLSSTASRYNIGLWKPGAGIIHQTVLKNFAFLADMMAFAIGVGGADAVDVMYALPFELTAPNIIGYRLTGELSGVFPYSEAMYAYLRATRRGNIADAVRSALSELRADPGAQYDRLIDINLSNLEATVNGPFTPGLSALISEFCNRFSKDGWPRELTTGLIGFWTATQPQTFPCLARDGYDQDLLGRIRVRPYFGFSKQLRRNGILFPAAERRVVAFSGLSAIHRPLSC
ncbi:Aconitate hydratase, mitochondrial protein 1, partial [Colletotrichum chlorophyti]